MLVIDDDADIRTVTRLSLSCLGMDVIEAASGAEGVCKARKDQPDVILLDMMMRGDGWRADPGIAPRATDHRHDAGDLPDR